MNDDFFDLGGHSLLATRLEHELQLSGFDIKVLDILKYRTIKELISNLTSEV